MSHRRHIATPHRRPGAVRFTAEERAEAQAAIDQADANAREGWREAARLALRYVALRQGTLTSAEIWDELDRQEVELTHDGRAMAGVMQWGAREGLIVRLNTTVQGKSRNRHVSDLRVWRSLVFAGRVK